MRSLFFAVLLTTFAGLAAMEKGGATPQELYQRLNADAYAAKDVETIRACFSDLELMPGMTAQIDAERIIALDELQRACQKGIEKYGEDDFKVAIKGTILTLAITRRDPGFASAASGEVTVSGTLSPPCLTSSSAAKR